MPTELRSARLVIAWSQVLAELATVAQPDIILAWYRKLVTRKFDGSKARQGPGRPRVRGEVERLKEITTGIFYRFNILTIRVVNRLFGADASIVTRDFIDHPARHGTGFRCKIVVRLRSTFRLG
jgi:hypothetical protein